MNGILLVNKSKNKTSFSLVSLLRKLIKIKKIGHAGTLDPFASGLMIMLIGREYTQKSILFTNQSKTYYCKIHLGFSTKSFDSETELKHISDKIPTLAEIKEALTHFQGKIKQIPPMFSAKKIKGQRLYTLARKNIEIERKPIQVEISTQLIKYTYPYLELNINCSKGTYIRSIANDIGINLCCGAYLHTLIRTRCGSFYLKDAINQENINKNTNLSILFLK